MLEMADKAETMIPTGVMEMPQRAMDRAVVAVAERVIPVLVTIRVAQETPGTVAWS